MRYVCQLSNITCHILDTHAALSGTLTGVEIRHMAWAPEDYLKLINRKDIRVQLSGWPKYIPFKNLSQIRHSQQAVSELQGLWDGGFLAWTPIPPGETVTMETVLVPLTTVSQKPQWATRSDIGGTHKRWATRARHPRTGAKMPAVVESEVEEDKDEDPIGVFSDDDVTVPSSSPIPVGARRPLVFEIVKVL